MLNQIKKNKAFFAGLAVAALFLPGAMAQAQYVSNTDTDATQLDYIEVNKREERENRLTPDQKQLLLDAYQMRQELREPEDPTQNVPISMEGDELYYDEETGAFTAKGSIQLTTLDKRRFNTDYMEGNVQEQEVRVDGKAHMLQLTDGQARIILDGYKTQYNYKKQLGHMQDAKGKMGHHYIRAQRIELFPKEIVLYNATASKCSAEHPDYHMSADKIVYVPNVKTVYHNIKYWLGDIVVYSTSKQETKAGEENDIYLPRVGMNSEDGVFVTDRYYFPLMRNVRGYANVHISSKNKFKYMYGAEYFTGIGTFGIHNGYDEDGNNKWIHKSPNFTWSFGERIGRSPFTYSLEYQRGHWAQNNIRSMHTYYSAGISVDTIKMGTWRVNPSVSYSVTEESYDHSRVDGLGYDIYALKDYDKRWSQYFGYHYSRVNSTNVLFDEDLDSYSRKFTAGFSYALSDKDRFVAGFAFDADTKKLMDVDYYWYHDVHCAQVIARYRAKRGQYEFTYQFNPW